VEKAQNKARYARTGRFSKTYGSIAKWSILAGGKKRLCATGKQWMK
jgi:hypothetical protein